MIREIAVRATAEKYLLPLEIVLSVIYVESTGYQYATRHEDRWFERFIKPLIKGQLSGYVPPEWKCTLITEKRLRATSFGYMQILGETARSILGFTGSSLGELYEPEINIELGCKLLKLNFDKGRKRGMSYDDAMDFSLWRYNGSKAYVKKIRDVMESGTYRRIIK